ncbi:MAG: hypothetical protein PVJ21_16725 [Anaerolineales bacterium]|jgi:hypothetical protein
MTNPYPGPKHTFWLEQLYRQKENHRPVSMLPVKIFNELKALGCVEGEPAASSLTAHGAGVLLTIRNDQAEALKQEKAAKRRKRNKR